jgi:hypothetical protein
VSKQSERPGVIYYCVSGDQQEFWVTMTTRQAVVAPAASLKRVADRPDEKGWVVGAAAGKDYPVRVVVVVEKRDCASDLAEVGWLDNYGCWVAQTAGVSSDRRWIYASREAHG